MVSTWPVEVRWEVSEAVLEWTCHIHYDSPPVWYGVDVAGRGPVGWCGVDVTGWYGVDVAGRGPVGWCGVDVAGPTTLIPCKNVSEPAQVMPMSVALRFPSLSIRSWGMMGCGREASGCGRRPDGGSRLLFTSLVRSHMARSRSLLS